MYYTYVLYSLKYQRLDVGSSENLKTRFADHLNGKVASTKPYRPWQLVYYEAHRTKTLARKTELFYKTSQGRRQLKKKLELNTTT